MKKIVIALVIAVSLVVAGLYYYQSYLKRLSPTEVLDQLPEIARNLDFELDHVRYTHTRSGVKKWELSAGKAKRVKGQNKIILEGVEARIFSSGKLKNDVHILARQGSYLVKTGDIYLEGGVKITNRDLDIQTSRLSYLEARDLITAPADLKVKSDSIFIQAGRADIDIKAQIIHFSGGVRTRIDLAKAGKSDAALPIGTAK